MSQQAVKAIEVEQHKLSAAAMSRLKELQQKEITESAVYMALSKTAKGAENQKILARLSEDEKKHYGVWKHYTGMELAPQKWRVLRHRLIARIFGFTFAVKIMETGEGKAQLAYDALSVEVPESIEICKEEALHEMALVKITDEESLSYIGSIMLGLNDALMELLGLLAGLSFSLHDTRLAGIAGLIVGVSATMSVSATEFLAAKSQGHGSGIKAAAYTGFAYLCTALLMVLPFLILPSSAYGAAFIMTAILALLIIMVFSYYISVVKELSFKTRFWQMLLICVGVGFASFLIAEIAGEALGVKL